MSLDSQGRWGPAVANALRAWSIANLPASRTTFITDAELIEVWKIITGQHQAEVNNHADIMLSDSDIAINPGTFEEQLPTTGPIIGQGENAAVTLAQKIK